jgi:hypothetical protein
MLPPFPVNPGGYDLDDWKPFPGATIQLTDAIFANGTEFAGYDDFRRMSPSEPVLLFDGLAAIESQTIGTRRLSVLVKNRSALCFDCAFLDRPRR